MPGIRPEAIALVAAIASILVQAAKGPLPVALRGWIPLALLVLLTAGGAGLAAVYGYDLVAGCLEGFFGAATAVGFYETAKVVPGVNRVFNTKGWVGDPQGPARAGTK